MFFGRKYWVFEDALRFFKKSVYIFAIFDRVTILRSDCKIQSCRVKRIYLVSYSILILRTLHTRPVNEERWSRDPAKDGVEMQYKGPASFTRTPPDGRWAR